MTALDQGVLSILNEAQPGCEANQDYARWAQQTGSMKSVSKNQQCPAGYGMLPKTNNMYSNSLYDSCKLLNMPPPPPELVKRIDACVYGGPRPSSSAPAPAPAPAPADSGLPMWAIALIVILIIFLLGVVGFMMTRT
jgi:hypothetical protein